MNIRYDIKHCRMALLGFLLIVMGNACTKSIQGNAGDTAFQSGAKSSSSQAQSQEGPGSAPSLSQRQPPDVITLESLAGEQRIGEEQIMAQPRPREASESQSFGGRPEEELWGTGRLHEIERRKGEEAAAAAGLKDIFFGFDSWTISDEAKQSLLHDAAWLRRNSDKSLVIEGHCDERGTLAYNLALGDRRAKIIRSFLVDQQIAGDRLVSVSYGKERPFCREHDEACYQHNRRGHLVLRGKSN